MKGELISLLLQRQVVVGAMAPILAALESANGEADELMRAVVEHAADVLDALSSTTARKERKALRKVSDKVELFEISLDGGLIKDVSKCLAGDLQVLAVLYLCG
eukprot:SAG11_NODE_4276_length_1971_cov_1.231303_1_plen_104_part_00